MRLTNIKSTSHQLTMCGSNMPGRSPSRVGVQHGLLRRRFLRTSPGPYRAAKSFMSYCDLEKAGVEQAASPITARTGVGVRKVSMSALAGSFGWQG
jgi:hypothetical protein